MNDKYPFVIKDNIYKSPAHYYQTQLFSDPIVQQRIINAQTPRIAQQISQQNKNLYLANIDKNAAMLRGLRAKFSQYPLLAEQLIATGSKPLIYHTMTDKYWADGGDGSGENYLGKLLEQVRTELIDKTLTIENPYYG